MNLRKPQATDSAVSEALMWVPLNPGTSLF